MLVVDSSVWIDFLRGRNTPQTDYLDRRLELERIGIGDLILAEVLQGCGTDQNFNEARSLLGAFEIIDMVGEDLAIAAARNYLQLRAKGITVRKTIDTLIASRCIVDGLPLLFSDRDFQPFVDHLGLQSAMARSA